MVSIQISKASTSGIPEPNIVDNVLVKALRFPLMMISPKIGIFIKALSVMIFPLGVFFQEFKEKPVTNKMGIPTPVYSCRKAEISMTN